MFYVDFFAILEIILDLLSDIFVFVRLMFFICFLLWIFILGKIYLLNSSTFFRYEEISWKLRSIESSLIVRLDGALGLKFVGFYDRT